MSALTKAYLAEISSGNSPTEVSGTQVDVQFNPSSLRVQISNRTAGGQQAGAQARQRPGTGEMQLSFDLVFDSADEGRFGQGVSVLEKTKSVERFVRPRGARPGQEAPPRVVFVWGDFMVQGTMESANIDLDLFDAQGVPLRAKVSVSIKGQDPRWTYTPAPAAPPGPQGAGSGASGLPALPGTPGAGLPSGAPGTHGSGLSPERILQAMPGESLAQLAARAGLDPGAWRALADGLSHPLKLELGQEVALPAAAGQGTASGLSGQGRDAARSTAALPLVDGQAAGSARAPLDPLRQGQAVARRGGLDGAIAQVRQQAHQQGAGASLTAFGLAGGGRAAPASTGSAASTPSTTADYGDRPWGQGVPLRPRVGSRQPAPASRTPASATPLGPSRLSRRSGGSCGCGCGGRGGCGQH